MPKAIFRGIYALKNIPNVSIKQPYFAVSLSEYDCVFCIPIKQRESDISSFIISESELGLDFRKTIVIKNRETFENLKTLYSVSIKAREIYKNKKLIINRFIKYLNGYKKYVKNPLNKIYESPKYVNTTLEDYWPLIGINFSDEIKHKEYLSEVYNTFLVLRELRKEFNSELFMINKENLSEDEIFILLNDLIVVDKINIKDAHEYIKVNIDKTHQKTDKYYELEDNIKDIIHVEGRYELLQKIQQLTMEGK